MGTSRRLEARYRAEWFFLGLALLLVGALIAHFLYAMHRDIEMGERDRLGTQAHVIHDNLVRQLDTVNRALQTLRDDFPRWQTRANGVEDANHRLTAFVDAMLGVRTLVVLDTQGTVLAANHPRLLGQNFRERDYFQMVLKDPRPETLYVSPPFKTVLGVFGMNVARAVFDKSGKLAGMVSATLDPEEFKTILNSVRYAPDVWVAMAHGEGRLFLIMPERPDRLGTNLAQPGSLFSRHRDSGKTTSVFLDTVLLTGEQRMMAQHTVQPPGLNMNHPVVVAISRDISAMYAGWRAEVWVLGGFYVLMLVLSSVVLWWSHQWRRRSHAQTHAAQVALKEKNDELERFFSASLDLLCIIDFEGRFHKLNPAWVTTLGYPMADLEGARLIDLVHPEDWESTRIVTDQLQTGQRISRFTNRYRTRSGTYRFIEWQSVPHLERRLIYAAARDVTEHLQVQRSLAEKEHFLRSLVDIIPGMVGYWDADLRNRFANVAYLDWFGKTTEQMRNIHLRDLLGPELFSFNEPYVRAALRGQAQKFERTLTKADGSTGYTWAHYIPDIVDGEVRGFFVLVADITELKQAQLKLEDANTALSRRSTDAEAASRAKSAFLANMSHEIRTPLNAVLGLFQLLQHTALDNRQWDYVKKAEGAAKSLLTILNDILDFSKVEAGKMELESAPFRLDELLRNLSVVLSAALTTKDVEVIFRIDEGIPRSLVGDALRLQQVLLNLAGNAIKFTEKGEVVVGLHLLESAPRNVCIEFSVEDTGIGIPADRLVAIFEGFTQAESSTTRRYGGTGLGLAICQRLVRLMGSELAVDSVPGQGSRFSFSLEFGHEGAQPSVTDGCDAVQPLRVLIVDDNALAREVLAQMAHTFGWEVEVAENGAQALALLGDGQHPEQKRFDVVCIDWLMPGMDGWETVQRIRAQHQGECEQVILMVTAHGRKLLSERLTSETDLLNGLLVKPVTPSMLFDAVAQATQGHSVALPMRPIARLSSTHPLSGLRILVAEDNPLNQQVVQELLTHAGAQVQVARNGRQAVESLRIHPQHFDVILMDLQMPEMDGYEATRILGTQMGLKVPIIAMTANAMPADREACLAVGMNDHVSKPIDMTELIEAVLRYCPPEPMAPTASSPSVVHEPPLTVTDWDFDGALARLNGNRVLYASLMRQFDADQGPVLERVRQHLAQEELPQARRVLHTLKGLAATLGANGLAAAAAQAEAQLGTAQELPTGSESADLLAPLNPLLQETIERFHQLAASLDAPTPLDTVVVSAEADNVAIRAALTELDTLLVAHNLRALEVYAQAKPALAQALGTSALVALDVAIAQLDLDAACSQVADLLKQFSP